MKQYSSYIDSGIQWLNEIPAHWKILPGRALFTENKEKNDGGEHQVLSLSYGSIIIKKNVNEGLIPENYSSYQYIRPGYIIVRCTDLQNDKVSLRTSISEYEGIITGAYLGLIPKPICRSKFINYLLRAWDSSKELYRYGSGLRQSLSWNDFKYLLLPIPTPEEQDAIVAYLDAATAKIDEAIAQQQRMIDLLNERKQIIVNEMVTKGLNNEAKFKYSGFNWIGVIPSHWEVKKLKYFINPSREKANANLPYIGLENIESHTGKFISTDSEYDISQALLCKKGDLIFGKLRPYLAKAYLADSDYCCSSEFVVMRDAPNPEFLLYVMLSGYFVNKVDASTYGAKMPRADINYILNLPIAVPPVEEQIAIVDKVNMQFDVIDKMIAPKQKLLDLLQERKQIIINDVVTGKIKVI